MSVSTISYFQDVLAIFLLFALHSKIQTIVHMSQTIVRHNVCMRNVVGLNIALYLHSEQILMCLSWQNQFAHIYNVDQNKYFSTTVKSSLPQMQKFPNICHKKTIISKYSYEIDQ